MTASNVVSLSLSAAFCLHVAVLKQSSFELKPFKDYTMMNRSAKASAFVLQIPLNGSLHSSGLFHRTMQGLKIRKLYQTAVTSMAKPPSPPPVKPVFYKNPSKAIEKGGGFFIPGLRGPRLRYFVSILASCLLALNHIASPAVHTSTQTISEIFAAFSSFAVLATAVADSATQVPTPQSSKTRDPSLRTQENDKNTYVKQDLSLDSYKEQTSAETAAWALAVCTDLTKVSHIAAFREGKIITATANVDAAKPDGPVIQRVHEELRPVYVANTTDLPADVTLPFLSSAPQCVFVVPVSGCVVSFSTELAVSKPTGFSVEERRWLKVFASRIIERAKDL